MSVSASDCGAVENVKLVSSDGKEFTVLLDVAKRSVTIASLIEDAGIDNPIPLPNVAGKEVERVVVYCMAHRGDTKEEWAAAAAETDEPAADGEAAKLPRAEPKPMSTADAEFCKELNEEARFKLILAANYLDVRPLLNLVCRAVANEVLGKSPKEIYAMFKIPGELTPEEDEEVRKENPWLNDQ